MNTASCLKILRSFLVISTLLFSVNCGGGSQDAGKTPDTEETSADLSSVQISSGTLGFTPDRTEYSVEVAGEISSLTITAIAAYGNASVTINGSNVGSGEPFEITLVTGQNTIRIEVTANDGITRKNYTLAVTRLAGKSHNADLAWLVLSAGTLTPAFDPTTTEYTAEVPDSITSLTVTPTAGGVDASIQVNGANVDSGSASPAISLAVGSNTITIRVMAQDGIATRHYTVDIRKTGYAPSAPTGLKASPGDGQITLSWDIMLNATSYTIYWSTSPGVSKSTGTKVPTLTSSYVHSGRVNGTTYYYVVTAENSYGESSESAQVSSKPTGMVQPPSTSVIIDHTCTHLASIPEQWIRQAKATQHIAYGHTSHGGQLTTGMSGLAEWKGDLYAYNSGGSGGALDLTGDYTFYKYGAQDLGSPNRQAWAASTRLYLADHPKTNVIIWSWCGQVGSASEADINTYLSLMTELEMDYPGVKFVYMTGHLDGYGLTGNLHIRNEQIREYCRANSKILYDFADIESYDPDGNYFGDRHATDACNYDFNNSGTTSQSGDPAQPLNGDRNWAIDWQNSHVLGVDWFDCTAAHTQPLNANQKAYAAWWLWARLAGWNGQ